MLRHVVTKLQQENSPCIRAHQSLEFFLGKGGKRFEESYATEVGFETIYLNYYENICKLGLLISHLQLKEVLTYVKK